MTKKRDQTGAQIALPGGTGASAALSAGEMHEQLSALAYQAQMFAGGETVELKFYGEIGEGIFSQGATAKQVSETLAGAPTAKLIRVRMSSPGGSVWEGMAIRSILAAHPARVEVDVEGLCASAATVIAMAGDTVRMHAGSSMMIHEGHRRTFGDLREHQRACATLEAINDGAADVFATRTGKTKEEIQALMTAETWFTPESAKSLGLADEIVAGKAPPSAATKKPAVSAYMSALAAYGYQNVPPHYAAASMQLADEPPRASSVEGSTRETNTMSYARIAMALGLSGDGAEEAAVMAAVNNLNQKVQRRETLLTELRSLTGKQADEEMLGAVRGLAEASAQVPKLQTQLSQMNERMEASERQALIAADAADPKGRKLTPALVTLFANKTAAELKAYLEVAPHVVMTSSDNAQPPVSNSQTESPNGTAVSLEGKTWEQMSNMERHHLHQTQPETYQAIRMDYEQRKRGV